MEPERRDRADLLARAEHVGEQLAADPRVLLVFVFGSVLDPDVLKPRDVDMAVLTAPPLSLDELLRLRAEIVVASGLAIDLVSLNDASIVLAHEVVDSGRCLFARDPDLETDFVTRARARYWDFEPYRREQWRLSGERLEKRLGGA